MRRGGCFSSLLNRFKSITEVNQRAEIDPPQPLHLDPILRAQFYVRHPAPYLASDCGLFFVGELSDEGFHGWPFVSHSTVIRHRRSLGRHFVLPNLIIVSS